MTEETKEESKPEEEEKEVQEKEQAPKEEKEQDVKEESTPSVEKEEKQIPEKPIKKEPEEKEEEPFEVPEKFKKLVEEIEKMSVLELAELVKVLEKNFGVSAAQPMVMAAASAGQGAGAQAEEKSIFNIELKEVGSKKIDVIKAVRDITAKGLKEAKDLVDAAAASPQLVKENVKKEEAEEIKKKFEAAGAKVELK